MRSSVRRFIEIGAAMLLLVLGCTAEQAAKSEGDAKKSEPAKSTPIEVDTAAPPEPPPPPEPQLAGPSAGEGFELGVRLEASAGEGAVPSKALSHAGAIAAVNPHVVLEPGTEGESTLHIQVRVEFEGVEPERGLNHARAVSAGYCDELVPELQELAKLADGRWLLDAQLACRGGEDYFSAENAHTLIVVDSKARSAAVLWTGESTGSNSMGVCVESSVINLEVANEEVIVRKTEVTELDKQAAKQLPAAAEGCVAKPETTTEVARISLARGK